MQALGPAVAERWEFPRLDQTVSPAGMPAGRARRDGRGLQNNWLQVLDQGSAQYATLLFVLRGGEDYYRSSGLDAANDRSADSVGIKTQDAWLLRSCRRRVRIFST